MPYQLLKVDGDFRRVVVLAFFASLLHYHGATAQSPSTDPDNNNNGVLLNGTLNGTVYAWCDYGLQNVAGAGGLVKISQSAKFGSGSGARIHTAQRYTYGNFSALIKCPAGDTSGLVPNFYVSSGETGQSNPMQDEIDFEWLGKNKTEVQVTYFVNGNSSSSGADNGEKIDLGFDCSAAFHEYVIEWTPEYIRWHIDGQVVKTSYNQTGKPFPSKPSFLYSGLWDASDIANGQWAGSTNSYKEAPFVFQLSNVTIEPYGVDVTAVAPAPAEVPAPAPAVTAPPTTNGTVTGTQPDPVLPDVTPALTEVPATNVGPVAPPIAQFGAKDMASKLLLPGSIAGAALGGILLFGGVTACILVRRRKVHATASGAEGLAEKGLAELHSGVDEEAGTAPRRPSLMQQVSMRLSMRHKLDSKAGSFVRIQL